MQSFSFSHWCGDAAAAAAATDKRNDAVGRPNECRKSRYKDRLARSADSSPFHGSDAQIVRFMKRLHLKAKAYNTYIARQAAYCSCTLDDDFRVNSRFFRLNFVMVFSVECYWQVNTWKQEKQVITREHNGITKHRSIFAVKTIGNIV